MLLPIKLLANPGFEKTTLNDLGLSGAMSRRTEQRHPNAVMLERVGNLVFGPDWQTPMADYLGVSTRTVSRWKNELNPVTNPEVLHRQLLALLEKHAREHAKDLKETVEYVTKNS